MAKLYYKSGSSWISGISLVYPVGALYQSFSSTSPATLFGGTWSRISNRVIRAASNTSTGGADTKTIAVSNLPSHNHKILYHWSRDEAQGYGLTLAPGFQNRILVGYGDKKNYYSTNTGSGTALNILPAYQNCYTWRRTA